MLLFLGALSAGCHERKNGYEFENSYLLRARHRAFREKSLTVLHLKATQSLIVFFPKACVRNSESIVMMVLYVTLTGTMTLYRVGDMPEKCPQFNTASTPCMLGLKEA